MGSGDEFVDLRREVERLQADKLALFANRFRARIDVYAMRWENTPHRRCRVDARGGGRLA